MTGQLIETGNTYNVGMNAINHAFSGEASFNSFSANSVNIKTFVGGVTAYQLSIDIDGNVVTGVTASGGAFQTLTDDVNINWQLSAGTNAMVTLGGNRTLILSGMSDGLNGLLILKQDSVGGRTITLGGSSTHKVIGGGGGIVLISSKPYAEDILTFIYDGNNNIFYWSIGYDYN